MYILLVLLNKYYMHLMMKGGLMYTSEITGKILGTYMFIVSIGILIDSNHYKKALNGITAKSLIVFVWGILTVIIGLILVTFHNIWVQNWEVIITLISWAALLKGIFYVFFPKICIKLMKNITKKYLLWVCWIYLIIGAYLMYMSFFNV